MKNLIKKILKEDLSSDELNWIREIDPMDTFKEWIESTSLMKKSGSYGVKSDRQWLHHIVRTKDWIEEITDETHQLLEYVENLNSSAGLEHTRDMLGAIQDYIGDKDGNTNGWYVDSFRDEEDLLWTFLKYFGPYGEKYNLTLKELFDLSHEYFEKQVHGDIENTKPLKEYNTHEKRSTTEISMALLHEAADSIARGLRLIESATQFAYKENNTELIEDLEELRVDIQSSGSGLFKKDGKSMNLVTRINDIIKKHS